MSKRKRSVAQSGAILKKPPPGEDCCRDLLQSRKAPNDHGNAQKDQSNAAQEDHRCEQNDQRTFRECDVDSMFSKDRIHDRFGFPPVQTLRFEQLENNVIAVVIVCEAL